MESKTLTLTEMAEKLPNEMVVDILKRLTVRDLLRYRCVAKPWCSLIDSPNFIKKHLEHALRTASSHGVVIKDGPDLQWMYMDLPVSTEKLDQPLDLRVDGETSIIGSCNGLVALFDINEYDIALWNPTTKRYRKLPYSDNELPNDFWDIGRNWLLGFGHDPIGDDYKLVRFLRLAVVDKVPFVSEVTVYSAKTNTWKRIRDFPCDLFYKNCQTDFLVTVSNALHWIVSRNPKSDTLRFIVVFDLATEEHRELQLPNFKDDKFSTNLSSLEGSLCVVCSFPNSDLPMALGLAHRESCYMKRVEVWVMKEYGVEESWTKLLSIVPNDIIGPIAYILPVAYLSGNGNGRRVLLNQSGKKLITHDLEGESTEDAGFYSVSPHLEAIVCVESLVELDGGEGQNNWKKVVEKEEEEEE